MCLGVAWGWGSRDRARSGRKERRPGSCADLPLPRRDHGAGGVTVLLFWPGALLSIFMECKRSFLFYFVFFVKLKQKKNLHLILEPPYLKKKKKRKKRSVRGKTAKGAESF